MLAIMIPLQLAPTPVPAPATPQASFHSCAPSPSEHFVGASRCQHCAPCREYSPEDGSGPGLRELTHGHRDVPTKANTPENPNLWSTF